VTVKGSVSWDMTQWTSKWRQLVPPKHSHTSARIHGVEPQKAIFVTAYSSSWYNSAFKCQVIFYSTNILELPEPLLCVFPA